MDIRTKEIINVYKNNELAADDSFRFHCTQCGECCMNRDDILLSPMDLFRIAKELKISLKDIIDRYCELYVGHESRFPLVRLKPRGILKQCPLLKNRKCSVHKAKPAVCAMFPIGRGIRFSKDKTTSSKTLSIKYFFTDPGCGDHARTQTVREWFGHFGISLKDDFFIEWATFQKDFSNLIRETESTFGETAMQKIWSPIFGILYLCYDLNKEFLLQFRENTAKLLYGLQMMLGQNIKCDISKNKE